jgi:hypothetical protein
MPFQSYQAWHQAARPSASEMDTKSGTTKKGDESKVPPSYVYADLRNEEQSILEDDFKPLDSFNIRVIDLEPAEARDAPLRCKIESVDVSREWDFAAVSYVWGPPVFSHTLIWRRYYRRPKDTRHSNCYYPNTGQGSTLVQESEGEAATVGVWADAVCS